MDRNREGRRASLAASNGKSRVRHRSGGSLRDSPDEDGGVRLRDGGFKKERDRDRDRLRKFKKRRGDRDDGGDDGTSEESVNEDDDDYDDETMTLAPINHRKTLPPRNFRGAPPVLKPADEMIGVSVPRKARSASTKRLHDLVCGGGAVSGEVIRRQESAPPVVKSMNLKSSNPEELELEIAEVLYGLKTQSQNPSNKKEIASNDSAKIQNTSSSGGSLSATAPKRKKPRQVSENPGNFSLEMEVDHPVNAEVSAENSCLEKSESVPEIEAAQDVTATTAGKKIANDERDDERQKEEKEKFDIDLMAPPFQSRSSPDRENVMNFAAAGVSSLMEPSHKESDEQLGKMENVEKVNVDADKARGIVEKTLDSRNAVLKKVSVLDLKLDNRTISQQEVPKLPPQPSKVSRDDQKKESPAQSSSFPLPVSVASWPGGLPPMGYIAPLQGLVSMEGNPISSNPVTPPVFSQPRGKRCATHYHIAQNIYYIQQLVKMNPFWPAAAGSPAIFGAKPPNFTIMPPAEFNGNVTARNVNSLQDKTQNITVFPGHIDMDKTVIPTDQRKQQQQQQQPILLQQTPPTNILHGPAYIFPFNQAQQQQAAVARPGSAKLPTSAVSLASSSATGSVSTAAAPPNPTVSFNYPNIPPSETQYLAILQNNGYPFPITAPPPNYRGTHPQAVPLYTGSFYPSQMIHPSSQPQQQKAQGNSGNFQNNPAPKNRRENEAVTGEDSNMSRLPMYGQSFGMPFHPQSFALVTNNAGNQPEKKQGLRNGADSHMPPQSFAVSFAPGNSPAAVKSPVPSGQSIAFSRSLPDASTGGSAATTAASDVSAVNASSGSYNVSSLYQIQKLQQQHQQQQHQQHQQHQRQQQQMTGLNNNLPNSASYPDHMKFQDTLGNFPQSSRQKNPKTMLNPQAPSSVSSSTTQSLKNHLQPQARLQQISFGSGQKPAVSSANAQLINNSLTQLPMTVNNSPRSISGGNKTGQASTFTSSAQTSKPSNLSNQSQTSTSSTKLQQQQQAQMFFPNHYMQAPQSPASGYYLHRKQLEQHHQNHGGSATSDPAKAVAAATAAAAAPSASKGHSSSIMHQILPAGLSYGSTPPPGVQAKQAEQKQPAA